MAGWWGSLGGAKAPAAQVRTTWLANRFISARYVTLKTAYLGNREAKSQPAHLNPENTCRNWRNEWMFQWKAQKEIVRLSGCV